MVVINGKTIDLEEIVRRVLDDLRGATPDNVPPIAHFPAAGKSASEKSDVPAEKPAAEKSAEEPGTIRLSDRVITLALVKKTQETAPKSIRRLVVGSGAVVTPSVRDVIKKLSWELVFDGPAAVKTPAAAPCSPRPGHRAAAPRTGSFPGTAAALGPIFLAMHRLPWETLPKPLLEQIDQSGERFRSACLIETSRALGEYLAKDDARRAVVLTPMCGAAAVILNRNRAIRALSVLDAARVADEAPSVGANALIIDPKRLGLYTVRRLINQFSHMGAAVVPEALRKELS
ncbi:MAG: hypothetical protein IJG83_05065 [Thermoguttaceae bacterium]|nr:hypothetical protein [Thermoguttaceae bacterium]